MSQDCSVPVLNDCTEISINDISVKDLCHHRPSQICIENETILTDNTDISTSQVLGSKSFLERVQSMDIAALFPRGSLNQKRKKKKKTSNVSTASVSLSSESTSSFNKTDNIEENDVNLSGSTEDCSVADSFELGDESGKNCKQSINRICRKTVRVSLASIPEKTNSIISEDKSLYREATKAFNKKLYLKKKSVNVSFDSVTSEKSLTENTSVVKRTKNKVINVSFDSESPINRNLTEGNKSELEMGNEVSMSALNSALPSPSLVGSIDKKLTAEEQPTAGHFLSQKSDKENASRILTRNLRKRNLSNQISEDLDSPVQFQETDDLRRSLRKLKTKNKLQKRVSVHFDYDSSEQSCDQTFNKTINKNNDKRFADYNKTDVENMSMELESGIENDSLVVYPVNANVTTVSNTSMELVSRIEFIPDDDEAPNNKSVKQFNNNLYLQKKPVNVPFDLTASEISMTEGNVLNSPLKKAEEIMSNNIKDSANELAQVDSEDGTQENFVEAKIVDDCLRVDGEAVSELSNIIETDISKKTSDTTAESDFLSAELSKSSRGILITSLNQGKAFNKKMYSKKKSINFSFNLDETSDNIVNACVKTSDEIDSSNKKISKNINNNAKGKFVVEIGTQENSKGEVGEHEQMNIVQADTSQPTSPDISSSNLSPVQLNNRNDSIPISNEESTMKESISDTKSKVDYNDTEEKNKAFNKKLYLKKKSVNFSFDLGGSEMSQTDDNVTPCIKTYNGIDYRKTQTSVSEKDQESTENGKKDKSVDESVTQEQMSESMVEGKEVSQEMNMIEPGTSQPTSPDISSSNLSPVQLHNGNDCIPISNEELTMKEIILDTESKVDNNDTEENNKVFNKKLYLKKKSVNFSFDLGGSDMTCTDDNVNTSVKTSNGTDYSKTKCSVNEMVQDNIENGKKDKSVSESGTQEQMVESVVEGDHSKVDSKEVSQEMNMIEPGTSQPTSGDISSSNLSPVQLNNRNDSIQISTEESTMKESISDTKSKVDDIDTEERNKAFNKKLYLMKKSVNFSFDLGGSKMSQTDDNVTPCIKTYNGIEYRKTQTSVSEKDQESTENGKKDKSVNESVTQEQMSESMVEGKEVSQEMNMIEPGTSQPTSGDISSSNLSPVQLHNRNDSIPISNEESTMKESISDTKSKVDYNDTEEKNKAFNKKLYLKRKSVNFSFDSGGSEMSQTDDNVTPCIKTSNGINYRKTQSSVSEKDQESTENVKKDKFVNESGTQEQMSESMDEGNHSKVDSKEVSQEMNMIEPGTSQPTSGDISSSNLSPVQLNNRNDSIQISTEESTMKESISDTKSKVDDIDTEERNKAFNKKLYLMKKSVNFSFDLGGSKMSQTDDNVTPCIKTYNGIEYRKTQTSVSEKDQESTENGKKDKSVNESVTQEQMSESMVEGKEVSQEMNMIEPGTSQPTSGDISSSNLSPVQLHNRNDSIPISNEESTMKESISDTKSKVDYNDTEEKNKAFNKKLYLKRKSVNFSFDSGGSEMSQTDDNVTPCIKTSNGINYRKTQSSVSEKDQESTENVKKDKFVNESGTQEQMSESMDEGNHSKVDSKEVSQEMNMIEPGTSQPTSGDISSSHLSPVQLNNKNDSIQISNEESTMKESISDTKSKVDYNDTEEKNKAFNKKLYLKNKSVNISFTLGDSDMTCTDDNVNTSVKTSNGTDYSKTKCSVNEMVQDNIENGKKDKSVSESGTQEQMSESMVEDNHSKVESKEVSQEMNMIEPGTFQPTSPDISSSNLSPVQLHNRNDSIPISNEESTMKESISGTKSKVDYNDTEEKNKAFNKKLYLKKKSVNFSFDLGGSEMSQTDDNVNTSVKTSNGTDYSKTKCSVNEMVQDNIENGKKDKSVSESGTQEQMVESVVEGDHSKVDGKEVSQEMNIIEPGTSQLTSADISSSNLSPVQLHNGNDCIPNSYEESISDSKSKVDDVDTEEKNKVFNKKLYLKNKSVNVSFTLGDSDMTSADNNVDVCVETSNETDVTKTKCSVINKIDQEYIDYGGKNKSVRKSGTEEHIIEDNHLKVDDKTPSQQINIIETDTHQSVPNGSNLLFPSVINGEEPFIKSFKAINKNLCFKNESVCISFDSIKSDYSTKETIQTIANQVSNTCNASLSSERINVTEDIRNDISNSDSTSPDGSFDGKFTVKKRSTDDPVQSENVDKTNVIRSSRKSNQSNKSVNLASPDQLQESDNLRRSQRNSKTNNKISKKVSVHLADTVSIKSFDKSLNNEINGNSQKTTSDINDISTQLDSRFDNDMQSDKKKEVNTNVNLTNPSNNSMQLNSKLEIIPDEKDSIESLNGNHFLKLEIDLEDGSFDGIIVKEIKKKMDSQETVHSDDIRKSVNNCFNNTAIENSVSSCIENGSSESDPFPKSIIKTCDSFTPSILQDKNESYKEKVTATSHQNNLEEPLPIESRNPCNNLCVDSSQDIICETDQNDNLHVNMETLDEMNSNEIEFSVNLFEQDNNNISERNRLVSGGATQENIVAEGHRNFTHEVVSQQINFVQSDFSQPATVNISAKLSSSQLDDGESDILINDEDSSKKGSTPEKNNIPSYEDKSEPREETNAESVRALNKIVCPRKKSVNTSIDLVMPKKSITLCAEDNSNEVMCLVNQSTQEICKKNDNIAAKFMEKDLQLDGETSSRQKNIIERDVHIPINIEEYQEHTKNQVKNVSKGVKISKIIPFSETETPNGGNASTCSQSVLETNNYKVPSISIESSNDVATHSHNINRSGDNESSRGEIKKNKSLKASKMSLTKNRRSTLSAKRNKRRSVTFATTARMKTDSQSGEIKLNSSFSDAETDAPVDTETDKRSETAMNTQMSIGLSIIRKENENSSDSPKIKKVCHSTPLAKRQKEKKNDQINLLSNENYEQEHIFACPDIPARNLRERSSYNKSLESSKKNKRDTANDSDNSENVTKKSKISYYSRNVTDNSINDISIIPNMNNRTQKKMYHSTPIRDNKAKRKESNDRLKKSISAKVSDEEQVQHNDKMIQVSKTIFGSSTEGTSITVSKKQSVYSNAYSNEEEVTNRTRSKRKSDGDDSPVAKRAKEMDSSAEDRSYHSNFISTLESESSDCTTRTQKRVTFKNVSKSGNLSTTDYRSSTSESSYYITRSSKKVGFREGISLIDETTGDIRDVVNNSDFSIELVAKDLGNDQSNLEKELTNRVESPTATLNYTAEEPEIILEENEIGGSIEMSTECSLFKKVKAISKNEKRDKTTATKKNEVIKTRQKKFKSSDYEAEALEKWVSKGLITFLNDKLIDDNLDYVVNTERIVSILCSAVNAVKHLKNVEDIDSALLPLKNILVNFNVCSNMIEYATFISRFTPFEFQRKALSLGGYFSSVERHDKAKLMDSFVYDN